MDAFFRQGNPFGLRFFRPRPRVVELEPWGSSSNIDCLADEAVRVAHDQHTIVRFTLDGITLEVGSRSTKEGVKEEYLERLKHEEVLSGACD